jgi:glyoxylase-like metal-dependent hydrolase (beta-lactamase superfamily II)
LIVETFPVGPLACNCTILSDEKKKEAIVVDGGDGVPEVIKRLERLGTRAKYLIHTHAHIDHIGDLAGLREQTGAQGLLHPADLPLYRNLGIQAGLIGMYEVPRIVELDGELQDGDRVRAGDVEIAVLHTPGHTPGSVCFAFSDGGTQTVLSGDTLFAGAIGRWDLGGTSMEDIVASIHRKLLPFEDETRVIPGHGPFTTIGEERNTNPYLQ